MCLLMVTMGQLPERKHLVNASENNPDGYGYAVNHGDRIVTGRSMNYEKLIDRFYAEMQKSKNPIGMFHARYTTHGTTMLENNHPFRVDNRKDLILAHNGMLPITPRVGDDRSDTRIFAEDVLGAIGVEELDNKDTFSRLEHFAQGNKIAILSTAPELRDSVYILNEHLGHWTGDIWWSNSGYQTSYYSNSYKTKYPTGYYGSGWDTDSTAWGTELQAYSSTKKNWWEDPKDEYVIAQMQQQSDDFLCYHCQTPVSEDELIHGVCDECDSCLDCFENVHACMCYRKPISKLYTTNDLIEIDY